MTKIFKWKDKSSVFADWTANGYRLPTEAEWEYAAGAGEVSAGNQSGEDNSLSSDQRKILSKGANLSVVEKANFWGLYNVKSSVSEWVWDIYGPYYAADTVDPRGLSPLPGANFRVIRDGNLDSQQAERRITSRAWLPGNSTHSNLGFRVCRNAIISE